ncbi:MAG: Panacea domain-containing protein [Pseudomonadota bacterium]
MARFDEEKALNAMIYLAKKEGGRIGLYKLVKLVYFADKRHLHEWGRTITGDRFAKMRYGPTPSAVYDMIKAVRGDKDWERDLSAFFKVEDDTIIPAADYHVNGDIFSDSEIEILDEISRKYEGCTFDEIMRDAHDKAWKDAPCHFMDDYDLAEGDMCLIEYIQESAENERHFEAW